MPSLCDSGMRGYRTYLVRKRMAFLIEIRESEAVG